MKHKITITVRENSFTVNSPFSFNHLFKDFSSKFISYTYIYNKKLKRKVITLDKKFFIHSKNNHTVNYTFIKSSLMELVVYLKFRGIDILNKEEFEIITPEKPEIESIDIRVRDKYVLRDYQEKYVNAVMDKKMQKALIELQTGQGKMQSLDCLIKIPNGWKRMGDIKIGDEVIAKDGTITKVIGVYPNGLKEMYKITFADGRSTECGAEHLWKVYTQYNTEVIDTTTLNSNLKNNIRCYIDLIDSEQNNELYVGVDFTYYGSLIQAGKLVRINEDFLNGSTKQRLGLLKGILGIYTFEFGRTYLFKSISEDTIKDIQKLVWSLGGIAKYIFIGKYSSFVLEIRCLKELDYLVVGDNNSLYYHKLEVRNIEKIGMKEAQCIAIEHPEHLYVTDDYIVTHNTLIGLSIAAALKKRLLLLLPGYVDKWKDDVVKVLDIKPEDVCVLQGKITIQRLLMKLKDNDKPLDYKVFIASSATLMPYSTPESAKEYASYYLELGKLVERLHIGTIAVDEIHEKFFSIFYLLLLMNVPLVIGMTATFTSGNSYIRKFQDIMFPKETRLNFVKIKKYIDTYAIEYVLESPKSAKYTRDNMYSHDEFETSTIMSHRSRLLNFIDMLEFYFEDAYLSNYKKGDKIVIFTQSIRFATMLVNYIEKKYKGYDTRRYSNDDPYNNLMEADIIISTIQKGGTAVDIPNLKVVFNTVVSVSEIRNKQSQGRLRELPDEQVKYYYFFSSSLDKHNSFNKTRIEQLMPYTKEYKFIKYSKKI